MLHMLWRAPTAGLFFGPMGTHWARGMVRDIQVEPVPSGPTTSTNCAPRRMASGTVAATDLTFRGATGAGGGFRARCRGSFFRPAAVAVASSSSTKTVHAGAMPRIGGSSPCNMNRKENVTAAAKNEISTNKDSCRGGGVEGLQ